MAADIAGHMGRNDRVFDSLRQYCWPKCAGDQNALGFEFVSIDDIGGFGFHQPISRDVILLLASVKVWSSSTGLPGKLPVKRARSFTS